MSLALYLLRHGETASSRGNLFCGDLNPELTDEGVRMAEAFAAAYHARPWSGVYASPMRRTVATVQPLQDMTGLAVELRDGLREIAYGDWEGRTVEDVRQRFSDDYVRWLAEPSWNAPTGGETGAQVAS